MKKWTLLAGIALVAVVALALVAAPSAQAQGPGGGYGPGDGTGPIDDGAFGSRFGHGMGSGPVGGMQGLGGSQNSLIAVAAEVLGIDRTELVAQLQDGLSIADVAGDAVDDIVDAFLAPRAERLAELVDADRLTQAEADAWLATMETHVRDRLSQPWSPQGRGWGVPGTGFTDEDGDGVCDHMGTGGFGRGAGRMGRYSRWG
jgi:hypothetical protein